MSGNKREAHGRRLATVTWARGALATAMRPGLTLIAVALIMGMVSGSRSVTAGLTAPEAVAGGPQFVRSVETSGDKDRLEVHLVTGTGMTPWFSVFPLHEPDRLVFDLPNYVWEPGLTAHLESAHPQVGAIRVGQFSEDPPVTRLVLDLSVPVEELHYRTMTPKDSGGLRVRVADETGAHTIAEEKNRRPAVAVLPSVEPATTEPAVSKAATAPPTETPPPSTSPTETTPATAPIEPAPPTTAAIDDPDPIPVVTQVDQPRPTRPELAAASSSPLPPPPVESGSFVGSRAFRFLGAVVILAALGFFAFWLRKRFQSSSEEAATVIDQVSVSSSPAAETETETALDLVRCRIVDGYLVLAPEGGKTVAQSLGQAPRRARIEGHVEVLAAETTPVLVEEAEPEERAASQREVARPASTASEGAAGSPAETAERLVAALSDDDVTVRKTAAQGLWTLADGGRTDVLVPYLQNEDPRVRLVVAGVLGEAGATQCADDLAGLLTDPDASVRASTVYAFSQLGAATSHHSEAVRRLLSDPEDIVRARAVEALAALSPQSGEAARDVLGLLCDPDASVREAAAEVTLGYADRGVTQPVTEFIGDVSQRAQALELLQQADDATLRRLLIAARIAGNEGRPGALDTISYVVRARWTTDDVTTDVRSSEEVIRSAALESLAIIGDEDAMAQISTIAETDPSKELRSRAVEILDAARDLATQSTS